MSDRPIPCFIYAVKSSPDEKDSIGTQVEKAREQIDSAGGRTLAADPFTEDRASGFLRNRGPELEAAIKAAVAAADEHDEAELWVFQSKRLARGSGRKGEARSLVGLLAELLQRGVVVRSVEDDHMVGPDPTMWGIGSSLAHQESASRRAYTRAGKERARRANRIMGGKPPDGYAQERRVVRTDPATGEEITKPFGPWFINEDRAPAIRRAFELAETMGEYPACRVLNEEGFCTESGGPWHPARLRYVLTNPIYCGRLNQLDGTPVPAIVSKDSFDRVQAAKRARSAVYARRRRPDGIPAGGRSTEKFLLAKLGKCARCGSSMYVRTSSWLRKDGSRDMYYMCSSSPAYRKVSATCDQPRIDSREVDRAFATHLAHVIGQLEQPAERADALRTQLAIVRQRLTKLEKARAAAHDRYVAALSDDAPAARVEALEGALERLQSDAAQLRERETDLIDLADAAEAVERPADALQSLRQAMADGDSVASLNARLRDVLQEVQMDTMPGGHVKLVALFSERGEYIPVVDENGEPMFDEPPDFYPDQFDMYIGPRRATSAT